MYLLDDKLRDSLADAQATLREMEAVRPDYARDDPESAMSRRFKKLAKALRIAIAEADGIR